MSRDRVLRVFFGCLFCDIREKDVEKFFWGFGCIWDINLKNGFGFVVCIDVLIIYSLSFYIII